MDEYYNRDEASECHNHSILYRTLMSKSLGDHLEGVTAARFDKGPKALQLKHFQQVR
jgi:hypothetical protein